MLQKMVHVGTLQTPALGRTFDSTTGQFHDIPLVDSQKVYVTNTKV